MRTCSSYLFLILTVTGGSLVSAQETLPVPKKEAANSKAAPPAADAAEVPAEETEPVVVGNMEHSGWVLSGPRGRHYFFGGLAVADYVSQGERRIVTLQQEEPTLLPKPDPHFLYYRELQSGNRWAIAREPLSDNTYVVFFQRKETVKAAAGDAEADSTLSSTSPKKGWKEFQRSRLEVKKSDVAWKAK
ncbi:MAG: hypothetical protein K8R36_12020 [Planctomycetales bacterium]|nr:hypothetical protein [Planctomycetales bacterium]